MTQQSLRWSSNLVIEVLSVFLVYAIVNTVTILLNTKNP